MGGMSRLGGMAQGTELFFWFWLSARLLGPMGVGIVYVNKALLKECHAACRRIHCRLVSQSKASAFFFLFPPLRLMKIT